MSEKDVQDHISLMKETGRFRLSKEQEDTISILMGDLELDLEEDAESTLELPSLRRK